MFFSSLAWKPIFFLEGFIICILLDTFASTCMTICSSVRLTISPLSFWSGVFQLWFLAQPLLQTGMRVHNQKQNSKQCRSWWDGSYEPSHLAQHCLHKYLFLPAWLKVLTLRINLLSYVNLINYTRIEWCNRNAVYSYMSIYISMSSCC